MLRHSSAPPLSVKSAENVAKEDAEEDAEEDVEEVADVEVIARAAMKSQDASA